AAVGADPNVDSVVVIYIPIAAGDAEAVAVAIAQAAGMVPVHKPVLSVFMSQKGAPPSLSTGARGRLPAYSFPENAALALAAAERYGRWRARPRGSTLTLSRFAQTTIRAVVDRVLAAATEPSWLAPRDLASVLRA